MRLAHGVLLLAIISIALNADESARQSIDAGLQAAEMLHLARPSAAKVMLDRALTSARAAGAAQYHGAAIRYYTDTGEYERAVNAVLQAKDAGLVTLPETQQLLDRLFAERPAMAGDLFAELLANLPGKLTNTTDLFFVIRNLRQAIKTSPSLAGQAAERIAGCAKIPVPLPEIKLSPKPELPVLQATLQETFESAFSLREHRGHAVLVNFWEPWCPPCKREKPILDKLALHWKERGLDLIYSSAATDPDHKIHDQFEVSELPVTLVFDLEGRLIARLTGEQNQATFAAAIQTALAGH